MKKKPAIKAKPKALERSRGAVALLRTGESQATIAATLDTTRGNVASYVSGRWKPGPDVRARILEAFKVPIEWWDQPHAPTNGAPLVEGPATLTTLEASIDAQMALMNAPGVTPKERANVTAALAKAMASLHSMKQDDPRRLLKDALWLRIRDALRAALAKHPNALEDVESALLKLEI